MPKWQLNKHHTTVLVVAIAMFAIGIAAGFFGEQDWRRSSFSTVRETHSAYSFVDPLLYVQSPESAAYPTYLPLKNELTSYANDVERQGKATDVSIYYRDLNANEWVGVNSDHTFALASMLKVATALAVMRDDEQTPKSLIDTTVTLGPEVHITSQSQDYLKPAHPLVIGNSYTVAELLWHDLVESDNDAEAVLEGIVGRERLVQVYNDLQMPVPTNSSTDNVNTAQQYSRLFRVLYSATYLTPADSQAILDLLSQSDFTDGLVAGVPPGTQVAHKFGESVSAASSSPTATLELHDCGIIYYPGHPYFLCVLTRGTDFPTLAGVIEGASALTWQKVSDIQK